MWGRRNGRDFFDSGNPFAGFGGFGEHNSLISSMFGKDPFDDPFFTRPFGGSMFGSSMFGAGGSLFGDFPQPAFLEHQASQPNRSKGPVIEELSDDGEEEGQEKNGDGNVPRKHSRTGKQPLVEHPDDGIDGRKSKQMRSRSDLNRANAPWPQSQSYSFQSSTVTYGGANGPYYTASTTRKMGGDGVMLEESKEADTRTGRASHRVSKGIQNKGHSVTRKLNSDGNVNTVQTLHNLNEDELVDFEEKWKGNARRHLPGFNPEFNMIDHSHAGYSTRGQNSSRGGWALPSTVPPPQNKVRINVNGVNGPNASNTRPSPSSS